MLIREVGSAVAADSDNSDNPLLPTNLNNLAKYIFESAYMKTR